MPKSSTTTKRVSWYVSPGALWPTIHEFEKYLDQVGYRASSKVVYVAAASHLASWLNRSEIAITAVNGDVLERFRSHRCECGANSRSHTVGRKYMGAVRCFVRFLIHTKIIEATNKPADGPFDERLSRYEEWLRTHRGLSEHTIRGRILALRRILPDLGDDPAKYNAASLRKLILGLAENKLPGRWTVHLATTSLRSYLRFLAANGECQPFLDQAVPAIACWRLASVPKYISAEEVELVIESCNGSRPTDARDRAILLLLARLGLRAGDVRNLRLNDIDWKQATIEVHGKGRRTTALPLPQDAGDALLLYIEHVRPKVSHPHVFLRGIAPYKPLAHSVAISGIVKYAVRRAGLVNPPSTGTNLLRHSAATAMLRGGADLDTIGAVLRHKSPDTTMHYAKVDVGLLRQIAQPWPEVASC